VLQGNRTTRQNAALDWPDCEGFRMSEKNKEFFYKDKDGKPQDKDLHEPILSGIDRTAEARVRNIGKEAARRAGLTEAEIKRLYDDN
jgi:hypothetical protein